MKNFNVVIFILCFLVITFSSYAQNVKSKKVTTSSLKYPKVLFNNLEGLTFNAAKSGEFVIGDPILKDTKTKCVPEGGGLKDVIEVPTYYYEIPVKIPSLIVSVKNAAGEVIYANEELKAADDYSLFGHDQCEYWYKPNLEKNWAEQGEAYMLGGNKYRIDNAIENAELAIKDNFFFELVSNEIEVEWYKDKDYDYMELEKAADLAVSGYALLNEKNTATGGKEKLDAAVNIWETEVEMLDKEDKKARINTKVGMSIYTNMANALLFLERFDEAAEAIKSAQELGPKNTTNAKSMAQDKLYEQIIQRKRDMELFAGAVPVFAPENIDITLLEDTKYAELKTDLSVFNQNKRSEAMHAEMAVQEAEQKKFEEAVSRGEVNPYEHLIMKTTTQGYMLMLNNKDEFPIEVTELSQLNQLFISNGKMSTIPKEIISLENLKVLNLANNQITSLPTELGELKNLKTLNIKGNNIPQSDIDAIQSKLPNCKIKI